MRYISFEWDKTKSSKNEEKHGVSFKEAQSVFYDESAVEFFDDTHSVMRIDFYYRAGVIILE